MVSINDRHGVRRVFAFLVVAGAGLLVGAAAAATGAGTARPAASPARLPASPAGPAASPAAGDSQSSSAGPAPGGNKPAPAPSATTEDRPSWFAGGEELFVPPYYDHFKGLDLSSLTGPQRERFLHWVNTEFCGCAQTGCQRDTIANCYTNDPACPRAPGRMREILEKVKASGADSSSPGPDKPPAPAPGTHPPAG